MALIDKFAALVAESPTGPPSPEMFKSLAEIEKQLEDVEVNTQRSDYLASRPIYAARDHLVTGIPSFWPIVIEDAPEEINQRIQPRDTAVFSTLRSLEVLRFEITGPGAGEPRSVKLTFSFGKNDWFEDKTLEKKFWFRRGKDGTAGLVSEPVGIQWKQGKDLTDGLLDMAVKVWKTEMSGEAETADGKAQYQRLLDMVEQTPREAVSFFAWFGYRGRNVSAEESELAMKEEKEKRAEFPKCQIVDLDEQEATDLAHEIFIDGEDVAIALSEDLYPGAIKYFTEAKEKDALDSGDEEEAESGDESEDPDSEDGDGIEPTAKRMKRAA